ncbi:tachykinin-like peptides receptor 86C [Acropora millepora]|uniref:tachykinin-like peptides receptor 86C n=1 Tax=Acropora millepora TaxID=45264 RepID=UPI001CF430D3|nr:tachykinin-like peptides receptor 86C [Acropora millepora]
MVQYTDSESAQIGITTMFGVLVTIDLVGNSLVCLVILLYRDMRTPTHLLLLNLAVADMMVALFIGQRFVVVHFIKHPTGISGAILCKSHNFTWVGGAVSVFTLLAIAFERYYAVIFPHGNKGKLTFKKLKIFIPISWICAGILNIPLFLTVYFDEDTEFCHEYWPKKWLPIAYSLTWFFAAGIIPVKLMIVLYSKVVYRLWFKRQENGYRDVARQGVIKVRKRVTKMVLIVSAIYAFCWLPNLTIYAVAYLSPSQKYGSVLYITSIVLVTFNSTVNPFIYVFVNRRFSEKITNLLMCGKLRNNNVDPGGMNQGGDHKTASLQCQNRTCQCNNKRSMLSEIKA